MADSPSQNPDFGGGTANRYEASDNETVMRMKLSHKKRIC